MYYILKKGLFSRLVIIHSYLRYELVELGGLPGNPASIRGLFLRQRSRPVPRAPVTMELWEHSDYCPPACSVHNRRKHQ